MVTPVLLAEMDEMDEMANQVIKVLLAFKDLPVVPVLQVPGDLMAPKETLGTLGQKETGESLGREVFTVFQTGRNVPGMHLVSPKTTGSLRYET